MRFFSQLAARMRDGGDAVLCAIVESSGSTPRGAGAMMAVFRDGTICGTVGGGALELSTIEHSKSVWESGLVKTVSFDFDQNESDMICGGSVRVALTPLSAEALPCVEAAADMASLMLTLCATDGSPAAMRVSDGSGALVARFGENLSPGVGIDLSLSEPGRVYVFGAGHVGKSVAQLLDILAFPFTIIDDRADFADRLPKSGEVRVMRFESAFSSLNITPDDYIVIVTRGHTHDKVVLSQALRTNARYIGMIGSRRKIDKVYTGLIAHDGFSYDELRRVHAPIGLPLGGDTPEEIAVSIVAELIKCKYA